MKHEDIKIGQVLPVTEFNKLAEDKWRRRCDENRATNNPIPYLGFYVFTNSKGNYKTRGFVMKTHKDDYQLYKLKREAIVAQGKI